jgi:LPXTG-site transpeptidase (sortase) family protein
MFKKIFLCFFFCLLILIAPQITRAFIDVPVTHDYYEDIQYLYEKGVVEGYSDFSFHPDYEIPRVEALAMIFKAYSEDLADYSEAGFSDVFSHEWFYPVVNYAWTQGIVNGHPDGSFQPRSSINTAEGLKIALNVFFDHFEAPEYEDDPLLEINYTDWYTDYFLFAKAKGVINKNKYHHPAKKLTRGELASILHRLLLIQAGEYEQIQELDENWSYEYALYIPKLDIINVPITFVPDFTDYNQALNVLWKGVGNFRYQPGTPGKIVIYGHSSYVSGSALAYKHVFRYLDDLEVGDRIYINYENKGYIYEVSNTNIVEPNHLEVLQSYGYEELALFTCWPRDSVESRYVVHAKRVLVE